MTGQELLTHAVSQFARTLARVSTVSEVLNDLAEQAEAVLGVAGAGVSVLECRQLRFAAASNERSAGLEGVQEAGQAGPSMDVCRTGKIATIPDLAGAPRGWSAYQRAAHAAGIVAVASVPMDHDGQIIGAVGLYSSVQRDWSADGLGAARILADMATGSLVHAGELAQQRRVTEQLRQALDSRIVIEQAKGVLAAERHISVDEAFEALRRHARSHSATLHSVAQAVVAWSCGPDRPAA